MSKPVVDKLGDADIRPALRSYLLSKHADEPETVVIEELGICCGQVRVDLAVVNGLLHGYEIKSERDSLRRLAIQVDLYGRVLDQATLVIGERHLPDAKEIVPRWWGILRIDSELRSPRFVTERRARRNPRRNPRSLVELLWLDDSIALLERYNAVRGVRGKPRHLVWDRICEHFDVDEIGEVVRGHLKTRGGRLGNLRSS